MSEPLDNKTKWIIGGVLGVAVIGGGTALAMSRKPKSTEWFGYEIRIEEREIDDATKPYRWTVAKDDELIGSGLAETHEIGVDLAKSAIEAVQETKASARAAASAAREVFDAASGVTGGLG
ncbi:MAG: hypothetical protein ACRBN8_19680 [Nannocystales bacterium]